MTGSSLVCYFASTARRCEALPNGWSGALTDAVSYQVANEVAWLTIERPPVWTGG